MQEPIAFAAMGSFSAKKEILAFPFELEYNKLNYYLLS